MITINKNSFYDILPLLRKLKVIDADLDTSYQVDQLIDALSASLYRGTGSGALDVESLESTVRSVTFPGGEDA
jgi:hypothetical protein